MICALFQIRRDMGGEKDRQTMALQKDEQIRQFISGKRIQTARGFIQDQEFSSVRECQQQIALDFHAFRHLRRGLVLIQREQFQIFLICLIVPAVVKGFGNGDQFAQFFLGIVVDGTGRKTDPLLDLVFMPNQGNAEILDLSFGRMDIVEHGFDRRCLPCSVSADKTGDRARLQFKRNIFQ